MASDCCLPDTVASSPRPSPPGEREAARRIPWRQGLSPLTLLRHCCDPCRELASFFFARVFRPNGPNRVQLSVRQGGELSQWSEEHACMFL